MPTPPDDQAFYRREAQVRGRLGPGRRFGSAGEAARHAALLTKRERGWNQKGTRPAVVLGGRRGVSSLLHTPAGPVLELAPDMLDEATLLHELAHQQAPGPHGRRFQAEHRRLLRAFLPAHADALYPRSRATLAPAMRFPVVGEVVSLALGAVDGAVMNSDLAAGRTQARAQRSLWVEAGALVGGIALMLTGTAEVGEGLAYSAEALLAKRAGMLAGTRIAARGGGGMNLDMPMPDVIDASAAASALGAGPATGGGASPAIYPAFREPAGMLG